MQRKRTLTAAESPVEPTVNAGPTATLVRQAHGGALLSGGMPGNKGGLGRTPSLIKASLRESFDKRISVLEAVADGVPCDEFETSLAAVLPYCKCPKCGDQLEVRSSVPASTITIKGLRSARPGERIKAMETMGRFGMDEADGDITNHPEVQRFLNAFHIALTEEATAKVGARVRARILALMPLTK